MSARSGPLPNSSVQAADLFRFRRFADLRRLAAHVGDHCPQPFPKPERQSVGLRNPGLRRRLDGREMGTPHASEQGQAVTLLDGVLGPQERDPLVSRAAE